MKLQYSAAIALLMVLVGACQTLGVEAPRTFNEKVLVAVNTVQAVRDTATALLTSHKISVRDAENVQKQADNAREGIDLAQQLEAAKAGAGDAKLDAAVAILRTLQTYLQSKQVG